MRRNLAVAGGRQIKNEDFTQYIQAFTLLEGLFTELSHGLFILQGVVFTPNASNFDISAGVIYAEGELCLFDGITNVSLPYNLTKNRVGINPREFQDSVTRNTGEAVKLQFDALGTVLLDQGTPRSTDKFLRTVNGLLRAPIDGNNNNLSNVWKGILSDTMEMVRQIPKPTGIDRYLKLGEFPINETQLSYFVVTGLEPNSGTIANLTIKRTKLTPDDNAIGVITYIGEASDNRPVYYLKRNDTSSKYELWVKSPSTIPTGELTSGVIRLISEDFTDVEDNFTFSGDFTWSTTVPTGLVAFVEDLQIASLTKIGKIQIASESEIATGTNDTKAITPLGFSRKLPYLTKIIEISDWDMLTQSLKIVSMPGIDRIKIRKIDVIIISDGSFTISDLSDGGRSTVTGISVNLYRDAGGIYDNTGYGEAMGTRGWITISYEN